MNKNVLPKILILIFIFLIILNFDAYGGQDHLRMHFIDVGYGDAIMIEFADATVWMIDAGGKDSVSKLLQHLKAFNIQHIDTAIITHPHKNHFEGFAAVLDAIPIGRVFINGDENAEDGYVELLEEFRQSQIPVEVLTKGQKIDRLPLATAIEILHPKELIGTPNGNAMVICLEYKKVMMLLTSDIELKEQKALIAENEKIKHADLIQVPHHGGPLSREFIEAFFPKMFVISTGHNPWGLPQEEELQRLKGKVYRTDKLGNIVFESDGHSIKLFDEH